MSDKEKRQDNPKQTKPEQQEDGLVPISKAGSVLQRAEASAFQTKGKGYYRNYSVHISGEPYLIDAIEQLIVELQNNHNASRSEIGRAHV